MLRDVLTARVPLILRGDIYATAAIAGVGRYLVVETIGVKPQVTFAVGLVAIVTLRLLSIVWGWQLPVFQLSE